MDRHVRWWWAVFFVACAAAALAPSVSELRAADGVLLFDPTADSQTSPRATGHVSGVASGAWNHDGLDHHGRTRRIIIGGPGLVYSVGYPVVVYPPLYLSPNYYAPPYYTPPYYTAPPDTFPQPAPAPAAPAMPAAPQMPAAPPANAAAGGPQNLPNANPAAPPPSDSKARARAWRQIDLGDAEFRQKHFAQALSYYREAQAAARDLSDAFLREGCALTATGHYADAYKALRRAMALDADWAETDFRLDLIYGDKRLAKSSTIDGVAAALDKSPHDAEPLLAMATLLYLDGQADRAAPYFHRLAQVLGPADADFLSGVWKHLPGSVKSGVKGALPPAPMPQAVDAAGPAAPPVNGAPIPIDVLPPPTDHFHSLQPASPAPMPAAPEPDLPPGVDT